MLQWEHVAAELGGRRTPAQCLQRYIKFNKPQHVRSRTLWGPEDDEALRQMVERFGTNWVVRREGVLQVPLP